MDRAQSFETSSSIAPGHNRPTAVVEHLAADEADVLSYTAELRQDRDTFKALAVELMGKLHETTRTVQPQHETIARLHEIVRQYIGVADEQRAA